MSKFIAGVFLLIYIVCTCMGRKEPGGLRKKGIHWLLKTGRKKGITVLSEWNVCLLEQAWMLLLICSLVCLLAAKISEWTENESINGIERPANGMGTIQEEVEVHWEAESGESGMETLLVEVEEQSLTDEEIEKQFLEVKQLLPEAILGDNESTDHICHDLILPSKLEGFAPAIQWSTQNSEVIDWEGRLGSAVLPEGEQIILTAFLSLQDKEEECEIPLTVYPKEKDAQQILEERLKQENTDKTSSWFSFPDTAGDWKLDWNRKENSAPEGICLIVMLFPFLYLIWKREEEKEKRKAEEQKMQRDYPEIVTKLTLLLETGLNLHKAMERIAGDYKKQCGGNKRTAYEAIVKICMDMQMGISEKEAYEELSQLCQIPCYRTLSALLVQQLTKGSRGMNRMLEEEAEKAYEMRRQQAEILGEQASTKLLFPMILMLLIVFVILMVPAWLSFGL